MTTLVSIDAPNFCSGVIVRDGRVVEAAPIVRWTIGKRYEWLADYCRRHGWKVRAEFVLSEHEHD